MVGSASLRHFRRSLLDEMHARLSAPCPRQEIQPRRSDASPDRSSAGPSIAAKLTSAPSFAPRRDGILSAIFARSLREMRYAVEADARGQISEVMRSRASSHRIARARQISAYSVISEAYYRIETIGRAFRRSFVYTRGVRNSILQVVETSKCVGGAECERRKLEKSS